MIWAHLYLKPICSTSETAQQGRASAAKSCDQSLILQTHMMEGWNQLPQVAFQTLHAL